MKCLLCYAISEIEMHTHIWYVLRLYVRLKCLLWENLIIMHQVYESRFALQPCYVEVSIMFFIIENFSNDFNMMVMIVYVILFLSGNST